MIFAGCDVGSLTAEAVLINEHGEMVAHKIIGVKPNPVVSASLVMGSLLEEVGLRFDEISYCVSTGYGRERVPFAQDNVSEISCHGKGAQWVCPSIRTIIDVGGQDCKVIRVDDRGNLRDFVMNDKCAAGTGRFLEVMARTLGVDIGELGPLALASGNPITLSSICSVFSQFDVMCFLAEGRAREDIAMGISTALAVRINRLIRKVGIEDDVCITGGVAKNRAVVKALEEVTGCRLIELTVDPQIVGALGAALFARERFFGRVTARS